MHDDASGVAGLVGLGNMGGAIAERLLSQGRTLHVHDLDPQRVRAVEALGGIGHAGAQEVADAADTVITCLPGLEAGSAVLDRLLDGRRIATVVETSTVGPVFLRETEARCAARGVRVLDCPVSGGAEAARQGRLSLMVAGPDAVFDAAAGLLGMISASIFRISGTAGDAQSMKLVNNLLAAANMANSFEALVLGVKLGLDPETMVRVVSGSSGANTGFTERRIAAIRSRRFDNGGRIGIICKDIALALDEAARAGFPVEAMPGLSGMKALWDAAARLGMEGEDVTALAKIVEDRAGVAVR